MLILACVIADYENNEQKAIEILKELVKYQNRRDTGKTKQN